MQSFTHRISRVPLAFDKTRLSAVDTPWSRLLHGVAGSSPYLARLIERDPDWTADLADQVPEEVMAGLLAGMRADVEAASNIGEAGRVLRHAKSRAALLIALADLAGVWSLDQVTAALSDLADTALQAGSHRLLRDAIGQNRLPGLTPDDLETGAGYCILAMGKHGARELNYSSDIDLICLFDQSRFDPTDFPEAKNGYIRVTRALVKLIGEVTEGGYVFRTDLRLRPSPSTTPVCMAMEAAERYYESVGRTWERAAHIKARAVAGDVAAGEAYLDRLTPFVWRRYLDFAAIEDTHAMLRKIRETKGRFAREAVAGTDIKLSPGGIREIEFFAQTRQLIQGGRMPELRGRTTRGTLAVLSQIGLLPEETTQALTTAYTAHRELEHRLQMIEDAQTHTIPTSEEGRLRVAHLMGTDDLAAWERDIAARLEHVHRTTEAFFAPTAEQEAARQDSVDLGSDALRDCGFRRPEATGLVIARWDHGKIAATRDDRARRLYRGLAPRILQELGQAGDPDEAVATFDQFLSGLPAGIQVFSLFASNPHLLDLIVQICALAPRLASYLGRSPQVLDALLDQDFFEPVAGMAELAKQLDARLERIDDYERTLDTTRRWANEISFRIGVQVLVKIATPSEAAHAYSALAEAAIRGLFPCVAAEFCRRHGSPPGRGLAVIAMGKLGSAEMTAGSDLDLIMVYDAAGVEMSDGARPLGAGAYYPRLTQMLLAALTAPTAEGRLYDVDMRLRPSGRQGPVAVSLESFARYQTETAWVWEHMALTRARVVAGPESLRRDIERIVGDALARRKGSRQVIKEGREMRARLAESWAASPGTAWELKGQPGGLLDMEFCMQAGMLFTGASSHRRSVDALPALIEGGWLSAAEASILGKGHGMMHRLQQLERLALEGPLDPETLGAGLLQRLLEATGVATSEALVQRLQESRTAAAAIADRVFSASAD